jgi:hypothetical protein
MKPWRTSRFEEQKIAEAIAASVADPRTHDTRPKIIKMAQWTVRVLKPHFLHEGKAAIVGSTLRLDSDIAADLVARGLCEPSP